MAGCFVVIGIPFCIFCVAYFIGVSTSNSLAHKYIIQKGLKDDFENWVGKFGGLK